MTNTINIDATNTNTVIGKVGTIEITVSLNEITSTQYSKPDLFVGYQNLLEAMYDEILASNRTNDLRWFNIYGESGVGKSTFAQMLCYHAQTQSEDGRRREKILWLDLDNGNLNSQIGLQVTGALKGFSIPPADKVALDESKTPSQLLSWLKNRSYIVVLDSVPDENLIDELKQNGWSDIFLIIISEKDILNDILTKYPTGYSQEHIEGHLVKLDRLDIPTSIGLIRSVAKRPDQIIEADWQLLCETIAANTPPKDTPQLKCLPFDLVKEGSILTLNPTMSLSQRVFEIKNQVERAYREDALETLLIEIGRKNKIENEPDRWFDDIFRSLTGILPTTHFSKAFSQIFFGEKAERVFELLQKHPEIAASQPKKDPSQFHLHQLDHKSLIKIGSARDYSTYLRKFLVYLTSSSSDYQLERGNILRILESILNVFLRKDDYSEDDNPLLASLTIEVTSQLVKKFSASSSNRYFYDSIICLDVHQQLLTWQLKNIPLNETEEANLKQQIMGDLGRLTGTLAQASKFGDKHTPYTAIYYAQKRLEFVQNGDDMNQKSRATGNIGALFGMQNQIFEAIPYHKQALEFAEAHRQKNPETYGWIIGCYSNLISDYQDIVYHWLRIRQALTHNDFTWLPANALIPQNMSEAFDLFIHQNLHHFNSRISDQIKQFQFLITMLGDQIEDIYQKMCLYIKDHSELKDDGDAYWNYHSGLNSYANYLVAKARLGGMDGSLSVDAIEDNMLEAHRLYRQVAEINTSLGYAGLVYWCCIQGNIEQANYWLNYPKIEDISHPRSGDDLTQQQDTSVDSFRGWSLPERQERPELKNVVVNADNNKDINLSLIASFIADGDHDNLRPIITERLPELIEIAKEKAKSAAETSFKHKQDHREQEAQAADTEYKYYLKHAQLYAELIIKANRAMFETLNQPVE